MKAASKLPSRIDKIERVEPQDGQAKPVTCLNKQTVPALLEVVKLHSNQA
jgi:hypothetical protein